MMQNKNNYYQSLSSLFRISLDVRQNITFNLRFLSLFLSLCFGVLICLLIITNAGVNLNSIYEEFLVFTFFNSDGLATVVVESTPLVLVGLSAALAFRVNFWNIGIEGQIFLGVIGATLIAIYDVGPNYLRLPLMLIFALIFSGLWSLPPAFLKIKLKINEVITTLLFNYLAFYFVLNQVYGPWKDPVDKFPHSEQYEVFERLGKIGWGDVSWAIVIVLITVFITWLVLERSKFGMKSRFCGINPSMAFAIGLPVSFITIVSAISSGAVSGLAGFVIATAYEFRLTPHIALGYGFSGIVIAFLAGNRPFSVVLVSFLMGGLYVACDSLKVFYNLPSALVGLIQAIMVLSVATSEFFMRYRIKFSLKKVTN